MQDSHLYRPKRGKIQLGFQGYVHGPVCLLWWGWVGLICPWEGKTGGSSGLHLGTRASSSGGAACSGSNLLCSLGAVTLTSGSALSIGSSAVPSEAGARGPSQTHLTFWDWPGNRSESQRWGTYGAIVLLCRASPGAFQNEWHTSGGTWPVPPFLHTVPLDNPEFPWNSLGASIPVPPGRAGQTMSHFSWSVWLAVWRQWLTGGHTFGPGCHSCICPWSKWEIEILSTSLALCHAPVCKGLCICLECVRVSFLPLLGFLGFPRREATRLGCRGGVRGTRSGALLGRFYKPGDF